MNTQKKGGEVHNKGCRSFSSILFGTNTSLNYYHIRRRFDVVLQGCTIETRGITYGAHLCENYTFDMPLLAETIALSLDHRCLFDSVPVLFRS